MTLSGHHPRFQAFLKRTLDEAQYEKIRTLESCIVDSSLEKKSFQLVVVDCDGISLENCVPWKVVHFADVISVELESDKPNFLKGQEKDDAQHIIIRYKTNNKLPKHLDTEFNRRSKPKKPKSKPKTSTTNSNNHNNNSNYDINPSKNSSIQGYLPNQQHLITATNVTMETEPKQVDLSSQGQKPLLESRHVLLSLPIDPLTHVKALSLTAKFKDNMVAEALEQCLIVEVFTRNKERLFDITSKIINNNNNNNNKNDINNNDNNIGASGNNNNNNNNNSSIDFRLVKDEEHDNQNTSGKDFIAQLINQKFKKGYRSCLDEGVMNLYVLNEKSMFYLLLKHAWINFKLRAANGKDSLCYDKFTTIPKYSLLVEQEFVDLKTDLLSKLRGESLIPSDRLMMLKDHLMSDKPFRKLFWKDDNLFSGFVAYLNLLATKLPVDFKLTQERTEDDDKINRNLNDVTSSILISMEIICLSLQETEIYPARSMHVTSLRGHYLDCLVEMMCLEMNVEAEEGPKEKLNQQLLDFLVDFTYSSINLLFEMFILSSIHPFCSSGKNFLTVEWLARFIVRKPHVNNFLERIMSLLLSLTGSGDGTFSPSCTLFIYKCFHVIDMLTKYCHDVSHFLLGKYRVELKYSLNLDFFRDKFPSNLQISADVFEIVERVLNRLFSAKMSNF